MSESRRGLLRLNATIKPHRVSPTLLEDDIRTFLLLLASLVVSLALGAVIAYVALDTLPCHWFGTGFEGACAMGVLWASVASGLVAATLSFAYLCYRLLRRRGNRRSKPGVS